MAYTPNPTDVSQPIESVFAQTAAAEFRALKAYIATIVSGGGPGAQTPGMIADFAFLIAPPGWLAADGGLVSRTTYAALWALVQSNGVLVAEAVWASGSNYGSYSDGDGSTTFRLPDFRSMTRKGWSGGRGYGTGTLGKFEAPRSRHKHRTSQGADNGAAFYAWMDGAGNPIFGSEVAPGASRSVVPGTYGSGNIRVSYTDEAANGIPTPIDDWNIVANNAVLTCIKT